MNTVQFRYVGELIRKPLDTFDRLKTLISKFISLLELYEEICDDKHECKRLRSELNEIQKVFSKAQKLLEPSGLTHSSQIVDDSENYIHNAPMDPKAAIDFANWNVHALKTLSQTENAVLVLQEKTKDQKQVESKLLARKMKREGALVGKTPKKLEIYKVKGTPVYEEKNARIRTVRIGTDVVDSRFKDTKVIMTVGMTGSGKTTMVNAFVNYLYGVEYNDSFRLQLVTKDEEKSERGGGAATEALSMTSWVTGYELKWQPGFKFDCNILLIDTPGFADPRGLHRDREIVESIQQFFEDDYTCTVDAIASVVFVMPATVTKLTGEQKYCIDQILHLFGKDLSKNMSMQFTFADDQDPPPAYETVKFDDIPFVDYHRVNNCCLYGDRGQLNQIHWNQNQEMLVSYFENLVSIEVTDLHLTKAVLKERDNLKALLEDLRRRIDDAMSLLRNMESCIDAVLSLDDAAFQLKTELTFMTHRKVLQTVQYYCMNCKRCEKTCHSGCKTMWNYWCSAFDSSGKCRSCDENCDKSEHVKENKLYKTITTQVSQTVETLLKDYCIEEDDPYAEKKLLCEILERYRVQKEFLLHNIFIATSIIKRLDKIALRNSFLTQEDYIKHLIQREMLNSSYSEDEKMCRIDMLQQLLEVVRLASYMQMRQENVNINIGTICGTFGKFVICQTKDYQFRKVTASHLILATSETLKEHQQAN